MCRPTTPAKGTVRAPSRRRHSLLLTRDSFRVDDGADDDAAGKRKKMDGEGTYYEGDGSNCVPTLLSTIVSIGVVALILVGFELAMQVALEKLQDYHPLFEVERNRLILARHIGVDAAACLAVGYVGVKNSHLLGDLASHALGWSKNTMPEAAYERRMFTYHPAGQQVLLFFFAYQVKNMYDTIKWNDGVVFIVHHLLAGATAWGGMYPGCGHIYAIFFMGISEISTAVLCLLANFDDEHGVVGLGDAFPTTKIVLGAIFALLFVIFRIIIWPVASYHFIRDCRNTMKSNSPESSHRRGWIRLFMNCNIGLSLLQVVFLGQIIWTVKDEVAKMM